MNRAATSGPLDALLRDVRACRICEGKLPLGPRPVLRASTAARILIVGQAPGARVHETGIPWNDPSGDRLRKWLDVNRDTFYDESRIAIIPMGYCYPGRHERGGDLGPRKECAEHWLPKLLPLMPNIEFTILAGQYAQRHFLGEQIMGSLTETVRNWKEYFPRYLPIPHPSPRNTLWLKRNAWFEGNVVPKLRARVADILRNMK